MKHYPQTLKYDAERDRDFPRKVMSHPGGEKLYSCIQCGTCSATCPVSIYMDHTPRQLMALTRSGFKAETLHSRTIWLCASCYACSVDCPKEIKITDIMYALKREAIAEGVYPRRFAIPVLAREFYRMVRRRGRITESQLVLRLYLLTNWLALVRSWRLGINLIRTGRFSLKTETVTRPEKLAALMDGSGGAR
jgi:quinone-modifying oxidoreductase subunit QmoC